MCGFRNGCAARPLRDETIHSGVGDAPIDRSSVVPIPDQPVYLPAFADCATIRARLGR